MRIITPSEVAKQAGNKYLGVLVAAKFARYLNEFPKDQLQRPTEKLTTKAMQELVDGRAELQAAPPPPLRGVTVWAGRHVVLGVSGGIACYKSCILARRLTEAGAPGRRGADPGRRGVRAAADIRGAHRAPRPELPLGAGRGARACPAGPAGRPHHRGARHGASDRAGGPGAGRRRPHRAAARRAPRRCCSLPR